MNSESYKRAESFLPWNLCEKVMNSTIFPYWADEALYYFRQDANGCFLTYINKKSGEKRVVFNLKNLIDSLSGQLGVNIGVKQLPFDRFTIQENPLYLAFQFGNKFWQYDIENHILLENNIIQSALRSPDNKWSLIIQDYNLVLIDIDNNKESKITEDGAEYYDYASSPETNTRAVSHRLDGVKLPPVAMWSPDSRKIITHKLDQRHVKSLFLLQNAPENCQRPKLHPYRMSFSGDDHLPLAELQVIDVEAKTILPLQAAPLLSPYLTPLEFKWVWWGGDNKKIYFLRESRGAKKITLCVADANNGIVHELITEGASTYVEPSQIAPWPKQILILEESNQVIWLSERSGYSHLYLYDIENCRVENAITSGEWRVKEVHYYDINTKWLYFSMCGYEQDNDPYYKQFARVRLDGSELQCLTKERAQHSINISPTKDCFLDTYCTIDSAPVSLLKKMDGEAICGVETADISILVAMNWVPPKRFTAKARDGKQAVYGNLYFPSNFNKKNKYPLIDHIYPGPQFYRTPTCFSLHSAIFTSAWTAQALAELGFIVMHLDGLGTPGRSKEFHDATYQNMGDCGIPDHVAVIQELAVKYSFIDVDRIGIMGYSGGGYAAARAMLLYPDIYKVGVSAAGNHDLRCYPANYGEKYNGLEASTYSRQSNTVLARSLQGKLLLVHGELDDNVHPCATFQFVDALIKHNRDFDMLIMPNQNHDSTFDHPYYMRKLWDYFVKYLLEELPPKNYYISPMPAEFPQILDW